MGEFRQSGWPAIDYARWKIDGCDWGILLTSRTYSWATDFILIRHIWYGRWSWTRRISWRHTIEATIRKNKILSVLFCFKCDCCRIIYSNKYPSSHGPGFWLIGLTGCSSPQQTTSSLGPYIHKNATLITFFAILLSWFLPQKNIAECPNSSFYVFLDF